MHSAGKARERETWETPSCDTTQKWWWNTSNARGTPAGRESRANDRAANSEAHFGMRCSIFMKRSSAQAVSSGSADTRGVEWEELSPGRYKSRVQSNLPSLGFSARRPLRPHPINDDLWREGQNQSLPHVDGVLEDSNAASRRNGALSFHGESTSHRIC